MSSVIDAGPCVRTNQLDFDDEVTYTTRQKLFDIARERQAGKDERPFCVVASLTHPHDPYAIPQKYWDMYRGEDIQMPAYRDTLDQAGLADDTIVIVTSDYGEMLGERGLWYKMTFFEGGCRVPLIVHAPGQFEAAHVSAFVSHLDLLPTLVELGRGQPRPAWLDSLDGRSLVPHLRGEAQAYDEAIGEYLAEGAIAPIVMLRRGEFKFIHTPSDPDQLFNVTADPLERTNLATLPEHAARVATFREEIVGRWDLDALREEVVQSQRRRQFHFEVTTARGDRIMGLATVGRCQPTLYAQSH